MNVNLLTDYEKTQIGERQPLPDRYLGLPDEEMDLRIASAKAALGDRLVILGHHYQRDEVIKFADYTGDSFKLARQAASRGEAEFIIFCGVHFMAESADILSASSPESDSPGPCGRLLDGRHGGARSARAVLARARADGRAFRHPRHLHQFSGIHQSVLRRARRRRLHVVERRGDADVGVGAWREAADAARPAPRPQHGVFPDGRSPGRHGRVGSGRTLGRALTGGASAGAADSVEGTLLGSHPVQRPADRELPEAVPAGPRHRASGVHVRRRAGGGRFGLDGAHHQDGDQRARKDPSGPWAPRSTSSIGSRSSSRRREPSCTLDPFGCLCSTMFRVSPNHLLWVLEGLLDGEIHNQIIVPEPTRHWAKVALDRMLTIS